MHELKFVLRTELAIYTLRSLIWLKYGGPVSRKQDKYLDQIFLVRRYETR